jgi:hypothetical protein
MLAGQTNGAGAAMRRAVTWIAVLLIALGVAHLAGWWLIGAIVLRGIEAGGPAGETLHHAGAARGGWPMRVAITLERPVLSRPAVGFAPATTIEAVGAVASAPLVSPREVTVQFTCPCRVAFPDAPGMAPTTVEASSLVLSFRAEDSAPPREWHLAGEEMTIVQGADAVRLRGARMTGRRSDAMTGPRHIIAVALEGVQLGAGAEQPFGREIRSASGELAVFGEMPAGPDPETSLRAWRDDRGQIELRRLSLAWGPLALSAGLTLALDGALQPIGAGTIRIANWRPALEAVAAAGLIDRQATALVRLALTAVSRPAPGGGPPVVEVPVSLEDRTLSAARFPIARLPEIRWSRGAYSLGSR